MAKFSTGQPELEKFAKIIPCDDHNKVQRRNQNFLISLTLPNEEFEFEGVDRKVPKIFKG